MRLLATYPPGSRYEVLPLPVRRFTVDEYHRMIALGFFAKDERFELLEGWIVARAPMTPPHATFAGIAHDLIESALPPGWHARQRAGLTTTDSEPEPDVVVVRGESLTYSARHPGPDDAALVVEVADTTLGLVREVKGRLLAHAGVATYWVVNLTERRVEVYSDPSGPAAAPAFRQRVDFVAGQSVPLVIGGADVGPIPVAELVP